MMLAIEPAWIGIGLTLASLVIFPAMGFVLKLVLDAQTRDLRGDLADVLEQATKTNGTVTGLVVDVAMLKGTVYGKEATRQ